jgi:hypothetical protein
MEALTLGQNNANAIPETKRRLLNGKRTIEQAKKNSA